MRIKQLFFIFCTIPLLFIASNLFAGIEIKNGDRIVFFGDNITAQGNRDAGYINFVTSALQENGIKIVKIPAGIMQNNSSALLARLQRDVLSRKPQILILNCGVSDARTGKRTPIIKFKSDITQIVEKAQAANIKVYILTATMLTENIHHSRLNRRLQPYNDCLRQIAKDKNCTLVDLYNDMEQTRKQIRKVYPGLRNEILTYDGIHMNPMGNIVIARSLLQAFGMTQEQITKGSANWSYRRYILGDNAFDFSVWEYLKLAEKAFAARTDVPNFIRRIINRKLQEK